MTRLSPPTPLLLATALCLLPLVAGCRRPATPLAMVQLIAGRTMGTTYSVKLSSAEDMPSLEDITSQIEAELAAVNAQMSTYLPDSEISRFNQQRDTEWFAVSPQTASVVDLAVEVFQRSEGAFDVTVGPLVNLWGFGPQKGPPQVPSQQQIDEILPWTGSRQLEVRLAPPALRKKHPRLQVDLSAIAKGHGVDRVAAVLDRLNVQDYFVEIGGEIRTRGNRPDGQPWRAGIEQPSEGVREIQQVIELSDQALATSGNYRIYFQLDGQRYAHTINPQTGWPVQDALASASVLADNCALADAVATSMMAAGFERGLEIAEKNGWAVLLVRPAKDTGEDARAGGGEGEARYETARSSTFPQPLEPQNITVR